MISKVSSFFSKLRRLFYNLDIILESLGRIEARQTNQLHDLNDVQFRIYSQWGEDGIIENIVNRLGLQHGTFVEFGVEDYQQSNTRFLCKNRNWTGLVIDGSSDNISSIKNDPIYWSNSLTAVAKFITKSNINQIISDYSTEVDLLSIDIDGNDYWVWESITCIDPKIVICEYNSLWGPNSFVTTPYSDTFIRSKEHYSLNYYGASIQALAYLAEKKGYFPIASNQAGNNVFFIRKDYFDLFESKSPLSLYKKSRFRESHDMDGRLNYLDHKQMLNSLSDMPLIDVKNKLNILVSDIDL